MNVLLVWEEVGTARMGENFAPTKEPVVSVYSVYTEYIHVVLTYMLCEFHRDALKKITAKHFPE